MTIISLIKKLWGKAFVGGEWRTACRLRTEPESQYVLVNAPEGTWIADPFLYETDGEHYLFVELYETALKKACIAYYKFVDGVPVFQDKIISRNYHMSYPCVFAYNGSHYMIPETSANETVELYKATDFPSKWSKVATLSDKGRYVDTTVFQHEHKVYAVSYRKENGSWHLDLFEVDMNRCELHFLDSKKYSENIARPAGGFSFDHGIIRPAQDCHEKYGECLIFYSVDCGVFKKGKYAEEAIKRYEISELPIDGRGNRIHTYNCDSLYECVDVYVEKFDLFHGVNILWRAYLRKILSPGREK